MGECLINWRSGLFKNAYLYQTGACVYINVYIYTYKHFLFIYMLAWSVYIDLYLLCTQAVEKCCVFTSFNIHHQHTAHAWKLLGELYVWHSTFVEICYFVNGHENSNWTPSNQMVDLKGNFSFYLFVFLLFEYFTKCLFYFCNQKKKAILKDSCQITSVLYKNSKAVSLLVYHHVDYVSFGKISLRSNEVRFHSTLFYIKWMPWTHIHIYENRDYKGYNFRIKSVNNLNKSWVLHGCTPMNFLCNPLRQLYVGRETRKLEP